MAHARRSSVSEGGTNNFAQVGPRLPTRKCILTSFLNYHAAPSEPWSRRRVWPSDSTRRRYERAALPAQSLSGHALNESAPRNRRVVASSRSKMGSHRASRYVARCRRLPSAPASRHLRKMGREAESLLSTLCLRAFVPCLEAGGRGGRRAAARPDRVQGPTVILNLFKDPVRRLMSGWRAGP